MPRSKNIERYGREWFKVLDQIREGNKVQVRGLSPREAVNVRNYFGSFLGAMEEALKRPERLEATTREFVERYRDLAGMATSRILDDGVEFLNRTNTPMAVKLREALRTGVVEDVAEDLDTEANAALERLQAMKAAREGKVVEDGAPPVSSTLDNPFKRAMG